MSLLLKTTCVLVIITIIFTPMTLVPTDAIQPTTQVPLINGNQWTISGVTHRIATGEGTDTGTWTRDSNYTDKYVVVSSNATALRISWLGKEAWTSTATNSWVNANGGSTNKGTRSYGTTYAVDVATFKIIAVSSNSRSNEIGHPAWFLLNLAGLISGGTLSLGWSVPSSDAVSSTLMDLPWSVTTSSVNFKGEVVSAWEVADEGTSLGWWHCSSKPPNRGIQCPKGNVYSNGTATETELFDSMYGIRLGYNITGGFLYGRTGGGWTETLFETALLTATNLAFSFPATTILPGKATIVVDGVVYSSQKHTFTWRPGENHTLSVNGTLQGLAGVRYVFLHWSDGSNETTRTITASTKAKTYAPIFKTQYLLTVDSEFGNPQGSGWYDNGTEALISVNSPQPGAGPLGLLGGRNDFQSWSGDSAATNATSTILMDGPKTVQARWTTWMRFPLGLWDLSLWAAVVAIILLITSELISPYYGRTGIVLNRRRLRIAALLVAFIFLTTVAYRIYQIVLKT
jgi:hypothetical protein